MRARTHSRKTTERLTTDHVGKIIGQIGRQAGIVVRRTTKNGETHTKYASAHDLRRGCALRLINAGVSAETLNVIMRHREFSTTERYCGATRCAQSAAAEVAAKFAGGCGQPALVGPQEEVPHLTAQQLKKLKALLAAN